MIKQRIAKSKNSSRKIAKKTNDVAVVPYLRAGFVVDYNLRFDM